MAVEDIIIEGTSDIPWVSFLFSEGSLSLSGKSLPSNPHEFYSPILEKLKEFLTYWNKDVCFDIRMGYFNTASSKQILELLHCFIPNTNNENGKLLAYSNLVINWYYNDEDMQEAGQDYADMLEIPKFPKIQFRVVEKVS